MPWREATASTPSPRPRSEVGMIGPSATLLGLTLLLAGEAAPSPIAPGDFQSWCRASPRGRPRIPEPVALRARGFRYVFVGGLGGELMPGYFAENARALRALGVPRESIHILRPGPGRSAEQGRDSVRDELLRIAGAGPERLVVIAHSLGACDALAFALRNPGFVRDRVDALFLVQGPFGGTGLADYVLGEGEPMDRRMPPGPRLLAHLLGRWAKGRMAREWDEGLAGLTREASLAYWRRMLEDHAEAIPAVGPKVYYVVSRARPSRLRLFLRATAWYLGAYYGPNDGAVAVEDQSLPGLGTVLGPLDAGHADLTRRFPASRAGRRARGALMRGIVMAVGRT
jgi:pimeloyl-ACP methyl ester carboxylesterase